MNILVPGADCRFFCRCLLGITTALMLFTVGCGSVDDAAESRCDLEIYYSESDVPSSCCQKIESAEIVVSDTLFGDMNNRLFRDIRRRARILNADAVVVGDFHRSHCRCSSCRKHEPGGSGPHMVVNVLFLRKPDKDKAGIPGNPTLYPAKK